VKGSSQGLNQQGLLFGKDRAEVEDQAVVFHAGDDGHAGGSAAETLLEFCSGITGTGDSNDFCGE